MRIKTYCHETELYFPQDLFPFHFFILLQYDFLTGTGTRISTSAGEPV
jgi:hypothetical protein